MRGVAREAAGLALLVLAVLAAFREAITAGLVAFEKDTLVFFYPLQSWFGQEIKAGRFPLWNPYIFGGYPMFADGENGMAHPIHLALLALLSVDQTFIWLRISSVLIAAFGMYALCRALGVDRLPAIAGGLAFSLGSFFLTQQHHENVTRTAAWLPFILACTEWGLRRSGAGRHVFLTLAAVCLGIAALGLHPQLLAISLLAFATFVTFRVLAPPAPTPNPQSPTPPGRLALARGGLLLRVGGYVGGLGLCLAAAQLLPLAELGAATYRGSQPDYQFATSYALPLQNLVTLLFPYFFRGPESDYWSLWAVWETTVYVGIIPLLLGAFGVVLSRRREAIYFLGLALIALWLAFASYAPVDLYERLWNLPGFSAFRVPGRYTFLFVLGWSVLAAFGLQALVDLHRSRSRQHVRWALGMLGALAAASALLVVGMASWRASLAADPGAGVSWIQASYLTLRHTPEGIDPVAAYQGLVHSLDLATPRTAAGLGFLAAGLALVGGLVIARRASLTWQVALLAATAAELLLSGSSLHRQLPVDQLAPATPAIHFLQSVASTSYPTEGALTTGPWRVYTPGGGLPSLEHDRLVPFGLEDIGGYSSAEPRRNFSYWAVLQGIQNQLADIANVRYVVYPAIDAGPPPYRGVPFHPERPLMLGARGSLGGTESFRLAGERADRLQVVAALTRAQEIPDGETVAEVTVAGRDGAIVVVPLRAGQHVAEWAIERPDVAGRVRHRRPAEVAFRRPDVYVLDGSRYDLQFFYSEHDLPVPMAVDRLEVRYLHRIGGIEVYGLGVYEAATGRTIGVTQRMRSKLRSVYRDGEVEVLENLAAFPRGYLVPSARAPADGRPALAVMMDTPFDPSREIIVEAPPGEMADPGAPPAGTQALAAPRAAAGAPASATLISMETDRIVYRATAPPGGGYLVNAATYFPGWRAWVDGRESQVAVANSLFRAVRLDPGEHVVELRYEPLTVKLGLAVSALAALVAAGSVGGAIIARRRRRRVGPDSASGG